MSKHLPIEEFVSSGLLQEVNRQFFHPLGLALAVESENGVPARLAYIYDARDDDEGFMFDDLTSADSVRGRAIIAEQKRRLAVRRERLGYGVQGLPG